MMMLGLEISWQVDVLIVALAALWICRRELPRFVRTIKLVRLPGGVEIERADARPAAKGENARHR